MCLVEVKRNVKETFKNHKKKNNKLKNKIRELIDEYQKYEKKNSVYQNLKKQSKKKKKKFIKKKNDYKLGSFAYSKYYNNKILLPKYIKKFYKESKIKNKKMKNQYDLQNCNLLKMSANNLKDCENCGKYPKKEATKKDLVKDLRKVNKLYKYSDQFLDKRIHNQKQKYRKFYKKPTILKQFKNEDWNLKPKYYKNIQLEKPNKYKYQNDCLPQPWVDKGAPANATRITQVGSILPKFKYREIR